MISGTIFITVEPESVALAPLRSVEVLAAMGNEAEDMIQRLPAQLRSLLLWQLRLFKLRTQR
jgi:hypothetical protein